MRRSDHLAVGECARKKKEKREKIRKRKKKRKKIRKRKVEKKKAKRDRSRFLGTGRQSRDEVFFIKCNFLASLINMSFFAYSFDRLINVVHICRVLFRMTSTH